MSVNIAANTEYFRGVHYNNPRQGVNFGIRPSGSLAFSFGAGFGKTIDFANGQQADRLQLSPLVEFNIGDRFAGTASHTLQRLDVARGRLFEAHLTQTRLIYHLNIRTFVRAIAQYTDVERNLRAGVAFMTSHGLHHFDAHFKNVLTDGHRLYFTDFGLAALEALGKAGEPLIAPVETGRRVAVVGPDAVAADPHRVPPLFEPLGHRGPPMSFVRLIPDFA